MIQNLKHTQIRFSRGGNPFATQELPIGAIARLGQGNILDLALSPDREYLVVATGIGIWWYKLATMSPIDLWNTGQGRISVLSFSADGKWLATAGDDGCVKVWDVSRRICITQIDRCEENNQLRYKAEISRLTFSPESQQLAVSGRRDYIVDIWHPETGEHLAKINADHQVEIRQYCGLVRPIAFSPDGQLLACLSPHGENTPDGPEAESISVWDVSSSTRVASLTKYPSGLRWDSFCFSPCGESFVASGDVDAKLQAWNTNNWEKIRTYPDYGADRMIPSYSTEGVLHAAAVSNSTNTITLWNVKHNKKLYTSENIAEPISFQLRNGTQLALASSHEFSVQSADTQQRVTSIHSHAADSILSSLVFSNAGKTVTAAYWYDSIWHWDIAAPSHAPIVFKPAGIEYYVYASAGGKIYALSRIGEKTINVWEVGPPDSLIAECELKESPTYRALAFAPENQLLAYGDAKGRLHVLDLQSGKEIYKDRIHGSAVYYVEFSPDGQLLASSAAFGVNFRLLDIECQEDISGPLSNLIEYDIAFSPCGTLMAAPTQDEILLWDVTQRQMQMVIPKPERWTYQGPWQQTLSFSPCGRYMTSGSCWVRGMEKSLVQLWTVANGENIATFEGHTSGITTLTFSPSSELLASGSFDGTILLWDMKPYL